MQIGTTLKNRTFSLYNHFKKILAKATDLRLSLYIFFIFKIIWLKNLTTDTHQVAKSQSNSHKIFLVYAKSWKQVCINNSVLMIRWIQNILGSWIRICKDMRIHGSGSKGQNFYQNCKKNCLLLKLTFFWMIHQVISW